MEHSPCLPCDEELECRLRADEAGSDDIPPGLRSIVKKNEPDANSWQAGVGEDGHVRVHVRACACLCACLCASLSLDLLTS